MVTLLTLFGSNVSTYLNRLNFHSDWKIIHHIGRYPFEYPISFPLFETGVRRRRETRGSKRTFDDYITYVQTKDPVSFPLFPPSTKTFRFSVKRLCERLIKGSGREKEDNEWELCPRSHYIDFIFFVFVFCFLYSKETNFRRVVFG